MSLIVFYGKVHDPLIRKYVIALKDKYSVNQPMTVVQNVTIWYRIDRIVNRQLPLTEKGHSNLLSVSLSYAQFGYRCYLFVIGLYYSALYNAVEGSIHLNKTFQCFKVWYSLKIDLCKE